MSAVSDKPPVREVRGRGANNPVVDRDPDRDIKRDDKWSSAGTVGRGTTAGATTAARERERERERAREGKGNPARGGRETADRDRDRTADRDRVRDRSWRNERDRNSRNDRNGYDDRDRHRSPPGKKVELEMTKAQLTEPTEVEKEQQFEMVFKRYYKHYVETGLNHRQAEESARAGVDAYREQCRKQFQERLRHGGGDRR